MQGQVWGRTLRFLPVDESGYYWRVGTSLPHLIITEGALRGEPHYLRD